MAKQELTQAAIDLLEVGIAEAQKLLSLTLVEFRSDNSKEAEDWRNHIKTVETSNTRPCAVIGVVGSTGVGKSKCINALLEKDLLPTSDSKACTAAPVEVCFNDCRQGASFRATIDFIETMEWEMETEILITELHNDQDQLDWNAMVSDTDQEHKTLAKQAFDKVKAVCPRIVEERPRDLTTSQLSPPEVTNVLGRRITIESDDLDEFSSRLAPYIGSQQADGEDERFELWPLIRKIRVYDKASILREGVCLVDLPGVQDNNAARAAVADRYLEQCTSILVMAPIVRAQSDKVATDFLQSFVASQLHKRGKLHHVSFVCTRIDESLDNTTRNVAGFSQEIKSLRQHIVELKSSDHDLRQRLQKIRKRLTQFFQNSPQATAGTKRKMPPDMLIPNKRFQQAENALEPMHNNNVFDRCTDQKNVRVSNLECDGSITPNQNGIFTANKDLSSAIEQEKDDNYEITQLQIEQADIISERSEIETKIRDLAYQVKRIRIQHRNDSTRVAIQKQFIAAAKQSNESLNGNDDNSVTIQPEVFCVCAPAYLQLRCGDLFNELASGGFMEEEDTGIPSLRDHCCRFAMDLRLKAHRKTAISLHKLVVSLKMWTTDNLHATYIAEKEFNALQEYLADFLTTFNKKMDDTVNDIMMIIENHFDQRIGKIMTEATQDGIAEIRNISESWVKLPATTYRAIVQRGGCFTTWKNTRYDFNDELGSPLDKRLQRTWQKFFDLQVPQLFDAGGTRCKRELETFDHEFCDQFRSLGAFRNSLLPLQEQTQTSAAIIKSHFEDAKQSVVGAKQFRATITDLIKSSMASTYGKAGAERGKGVRNRIHAIIMRKIESAGPKLFETTSSKVMKQVRQKLKKTKKNLFANMKKLTSMHIKYHYSCLTSRSREDRDLRIKHSQVISPMISAYEADHLKPMLTLLQNLGYGVDSFGEGPAWDKIKDEKFDDVHQERDDLLRIKAEDEDGALTGIEQPGDFCGLA